MKNPAPYIRSQVFQLLNGAVLYESNVVPVFESGTEGDDPYKIIIEDEDYSAWRTKVSSNWNGTQRLEVVSESDSNVKKHVDAIRSIVMQILEPSLYTIAIPTNADWQITQLRATPKRIIDDLAADGRYIKRAPIELEFFITER